MIAPQYPENEKDRQVAVEKYQLLDTFSEESYDNITSLMSYICDAPISLITLLDKDRNFLKSHHGIPFNESPRNISFCGHAINSDAPITIIEDARVDDRFIDNPLVAEHGAVFYAGAPLVDADGFKLGTLCVYDNKPRKLNPQQVESLVMMSKQVIKLFEQRYQNLVLKKYQESLKMRNDNLVKFSGIVSHDLKSPLSNIISLTELLEAENKDHLSEESLEYIKHLKTSSYALKDYIDGLLNYYKNDDSLFDKKEQINVILLIEELRAFCKKDHVKINLHSDIEFLYLVKSPLMQILINLVTNAIKYNKKTETIIDLSVFETEDFYEFEVTDNANGISRKFISKIFDLFTVGETPDKNGNVGTGIGLATVSKIVEKLGGTISVSSKVGKGSTFKFSLLK